MSTRTLELPRLPVLDSLAQDFRCGLRQLRKSPGFAAIAVVTLALGIGANTTVFSLVQGLLLRRLSVPHPEELVRYSLAARLGSELDREWSSFALSELPVLSGPMFENLRKRQTACTDLLAWEEYRQLTYTQNDETRFIRGALVTGSALRLLGLKAEAGRLLDDQDDAPGGGPAGWAADISYEFWQSRFHGDASVVGQTLAVSGVPFTIIGVLPRGFEGVLIGGYPEIILPLEIDTIFAAVRGRPSIRQNKYFSQLTVMGRLKPGVTVKQARANAEAMQEGMWDDAMPPVVRHNLFVADHKLEVMSASAGWSGYRDAYQKPLLIVQALVGVVLLLISANLAGLLLARASGRRHELEIRGALGASRIRLIRQLLTENTTLAAIAVPLGCLFAWQTGGFAARLIAAPGTRLDINRWQDPTVLAIAAASGFVTAILAGTLPALIVTRARRSGTLQTGGRQSASRHGRLGSMLIPLQVAFGLILVTVATLFVASLARLLITSSGMREQGIFMAGTKLDRRPEKGDQLDALYARMIEYLEAQPGIQSASLALREPMTGSVETSHFISREASGAVHEDSFEHSMVNAVGPRFFETLGIPMRGGRDFAATDTAHSSEVCILSESAARYFFPNQDAIGGYIEAPSDVARLKAATYQVVGLVADAKYDTLHEDAPAAVYIPYTQQAEAVSPGAGTPSPHADLSFVILGSDSSLLSAAYRETLRKFVPDTPVFDVVSLRRHMLESISADRMIASLSGFLGFLALLLTCISLYGQVASSVTERTSEIGIRMALGATRASVVRMICGSLAVPVAIGMAVGLAGAIAISRVLASFLYNTQPADPKLVLCSLGAMFLAVAIASYRPAHRAASIDPMQCLRTD